MVYVPALVDARLAVAFKTLSSSPIGILGAAVLPALRGYEPEGHESLVNVRKPQLLSVLGAGFQSFGRAREGFEGSLGVGDEPRQLRGKSSHGGKGARKRVGDGHSLDPGFTLADSRLGEDPHLSVRIVSLGEDLRRGTQERDRLGPAPRERDRHRRKLFDEGCEALGRLVHCARRPELVFKAAHPSGSSHALSSASKALLRPHQALRVTPDPFPTVLLFLPLFPTGNARGRARAGDPSKTRCEKGSGVTRKRAARNEIVRPLVECPRSEGATGPSELLTPESPSRTSRGSQSSRKGKQMTEQTVRAPRALEDQPRLRREVDRAEVARLEARAARRTAVTLMGQASQLRADRKYQSRREQARTDSELERLRLAASDEWERHGKFRDRQLRILGSLRVRASEAGLLDALQTYVIREARRLPEIVRGLSYGGAWDEFYAVTAACRALWDLRPTEVQAAVRLFWESPEGRAHDRARLKLRDAKRLKDGHFRAPKIKANKRKREADRRASMTDVEREAYRAAQRERYRRRKLLAAHPPLVDVFHDIISEQRAA